MRLILSVVAISINLFFQLPFVTRGNIFEHITPAAIKPILVEEFIYEIPIPESFYIIKKLCFILNQKCLSEIELQNITENCASGIFRPVKQNDLANFFFTHPQSWGFILPLLARGDG